MYRLLRIAEWGFHYHQSILRMGGLGEYLSFCDNAMAVRDIWYVMDSKHTTLIDCSQHMEHAMSPSDFYMATWSGYGDTLPLSSLMEARPITSTVDHWQWPKKSLWSVSTTMSYLWTRQSWIQISLRRERKEFSFFYGTSFMSHLHLTCRTIRWWKTKSAAGNSIKHTLRRHSSLYADIYLLHEHWPF